MKSRKSKQHLLSLAHFNVPEDSLVTDYHEFFNAWTQGESKIFTWYLRIYDYLAKLFELTPQKTLFVQLIPVNQRQKSQFFIVNRIEKNEE